MPTLYSLNLSGEFQKRTPEYGTRNSEGEVKHQTYQT
jgi:hypothetical protein